MNKTAEFKLLNLIHNSDIEYNTSNIKTSITYDKINQV